MVFARPLLKIWSSTDKVCFSNLVTMMYEDDLGGDDAGKDGIEMGIIAQEPVFAP